MDSIIFDIDGTIWNSTDVVAMAWNKALEKENLDVRVTADQLKGLFGRLLRILRRQSFQNRLKRSSFGSSISAARLSTICCVRWGHLFTTDWKKL